MAVCHYYFSLWLIYMSDVDEYSEEEVLERNLQLVITLNNALVNTIKNLEKINVELCKMVSNINNVSFVTKKKIDDIQKIL